MFVFCALSLLFKLTPMGAYLFATDVGILPDWSEYIVVVALTTVAWLAVTYLTPPEDDGVLYRFYQKTRPGGPGWKRIIDRHPSSDLADAETSWSVPSGILAMLVGSVFIYAALFAVGYWIYGRWTYALVWTGISLLAGGALLLLWKRIKNIIE